MPDLDFDHDERYNGGSKWPNSHKIIGLHPDTGEQVGFLDYRTPSKAKDKIQIDRLEVHSDHKGNGFGGQMMDHLQERHPRVGIDHGDRTPEGERWWKSYSRGKSVQKGRTAASRQESSVLWQRTASDGYLEPLDAAQQSMHYTHPVWNQPLGSEHDATESFRHLLRRGGHPEAEDAEAFQHPSPGWHQSQLGRGDVGQLTAAIHPDRWNYGTLAHETAHALHQHASGRATSREHAHDDDFMEHYRNVGNMVSPGAGDVLHEAYHRGRLGFKTAAAASGGRIVHDDPNCRVCAQTEPGMVRLGAEDPEPFRNPESGEDRDRDFAPEPEGGPHGVHWYHGTKAQFHGPLREPARDVKGNSRAAEDWNTELGVHFSSLHRVAQESFADNNGGSPHSRIAHATLHMANPKRFGNEDDLTTHAVKWAHGAGHRFLPEDPQAHKAFYHHNMDMVEQADKGGRSYGHIQEHMTENTREKISDLDRHGPSSAHTSAKRSWMNHHPERHQLVHAYRDHLRDQGHDGILYGNDFEDPIGHTSAIAFPSTPVKVDRWEHTHKSHPEYGKTGAQQGPHCPCGLPVEFDPENGWQHADGSISHDGELSDKSVSDLMEERHDRTAGKGKPRRDAPDVARRADEAGEGSAHGLAPDSGRGDDGGGASAPLRPLNEHPKVTRDLTRLPRNVQTVYHERVDGLRRGESHSSTHALNGPLKGWQATNLNFLNRVVHRNVGDELHVLSVGNHDEAYDQGIRRSGRFSGFADSERTPPTPAGFRHYEPSTWGEDYTRHAQSHPHQTAVNHAHESVRQLHPGITQSIGADRHAGSEHVQHVLGELGHPEAEHSFAMPHPKPEHRLSCPVYDGDGTPGVAMHPGHWDVEHTAHEIAHIMHNHETGREPGTAVDDEQAHGPGFVRHFRNALNVTHPGAGDDLAEHADHWRGEIDGLRREARYTAPRARLFGPTYGLDSRLFEGEQLRPAVRVDVVTRFDSFCQRHGYEGWHRWAKIVFFGSEASNWSSPQLIGNGDFDLSIGVDYPTFRRDNPRFAAINDQEIASMLTEQMHQEINDPQHYFEV